MGESKNEANSVGLEFRVFCELVVHVGSEFHVI